LESVLSPTVIRSVQFFSYLSDRHCYYLLERERERELKLELELDNKAASVT